MNGLRPRTGSAGLTLIEIMVVVFILGLLATLVVANVTGRTDEARRTATIAQIREIEQALHLYKLDNGFYPTTEQGLEALVAMPETDPVPRNWKPEGYLRKVPADAWGNPYLYLSDGSVYSITSLGADGVEGGENKFADIDSRDL